MYKDESKLSFKSDGAEAHHLLAQDLDARVCHRETLHVCVHAYGHSKNVYHKDVSLIFVKIMYFPRGISTYFYIYTLFYVLFTNWLVPNWWYGIFDVGPIR